VILSEDVVSWSIVIQEGSTDAFSDGGSEPDQRSNIFSAEGGPGEWTVIVDLTDVAGNRQQMRLSTDLSAPEATVGEQVSTPGSLHNLAALSAFIFFLLVLRGFKGKAASDDDPWSTLEVSEIIDAEYENEFEDEPHEAAASSNDE
jgi:hypothetical protein